MKFKNYRSAIHNFAHSFQSNDYTHSGRLAINVLVHLKNQSFNPIATFDFVNKAIEPEEAITLSSKQLLKDYINWLPTHFENHNCDITKLEKLQITISANFDRAFRPQGMIDCKQINISTRTNWKADNRKEEIIEISLDELFNDEFLATGMPEFVSNP